MTRLTNLTMLCDAMLWGPVDLVRVTGKRTSSYYSSIKSGSKKMFDVARDLESEIGLPTGWFDLPHTWEDVLKLCPELEAKGKTKGKPRKGKKVIVTTASPTIDDLADNLEASQSRIDRDGFSPMAIKLAVEFDRIQGVENQVSAFAACVATIARLTESDRD